jgi:hypothetical protein
LEIRRISHIVIRKRKSTFIVTPKKFNNITERVVDDLKRASSSDSQISIAAASFSIYAYEVLKEELDKMDSVNFIFTSPTFRTLLNKFLRHI